MSHEKKTEKKEKTKDKPNVTDTDKVKEMTETLQRLQAEFENFRKRTEKEKVEFCKYAKKDIILDLLPIIDNFELAMNNTDKPDEFIKGVSMVFAQLKEMLKKEGINTIKSIGEKFDPNLHEALLSEPSDKVGIILDEFQKGYMLDGRVLRHTQVKVGAKRKTDDNKKDHKEGDPQKSC